jgi:hypothetical protein
MMERETGVMQPQAKEHWSHRNLEKKGRILPWHLQRECGTAGPLISYFWPSEFGQGTFLLCSVVGVSFAFGAMEKEKVMGPLHGVSACPF